MLVNFPRLISLSICPRTSVLSFIDKRDDTIAPLCSYLMDCFRLLIFHLPLTAAKVCIRYIITLVSLHHLSATESSGASFSIRVKYKPYHRSVGKSAGVKKEMRMQRDWKELRSPWIQMSISLDLRNDIE
jgi:hypothetical protein